MAAERTGSAIEARGVSRVFGSGASRVVALDDVSLTIGQNEFFTLLGPSGCGKTTLLRLIAGFDLPTGGTILLEGQDISHLPPFQRPVNTVFQSYALFPHMTVAGNIAFGLEMLGKPKPEIDETVSRMLQLVQMGELRNRRTSELSGGQQQRVALARALAPHPRVLLLDEPLSALDYKLRKDMQLELKRLQHETGITFVFVTHDQEEALTMSDRIAVMDNGHIRQVGAPRDIYDHPADRFVANFIGETNFLTSKVVSSGKGHAKLRLPSGAVVTVPLRAGQSSLERKQATIVIRPEHAELVRPGASVQLKGELSNVVYFGTDTHFHVKLESGENFIVRSQNRRDVEGQFSTGQKAGISFSPDAIQVLRD